MTLSMTHGAAVRILLLAGGLVATTGCPGDDEGTETTVAATTATGTSATATAGSSGADSTAGTATSLGTASGATSASGTSSAADCSDASDETSCGAAQNQAEGGGCTWMSIYELTIDGETCSFAPTDRGECVGTSGLDDGCNSGFLCESGDVEVYYAEAGADTWEMAQGRACRGISGFMQCTDTMDAPCSCACGIP